MSGIVDSHKKANSLAAMDHGEEYIAVCHAVAVAVHNSSYARPKENMMITDSEIVLQLQGRRHTRESNQMQPPMRSAVESK